MTIVSARRCPRVHNARASNPAGANGLRYEKRVALALRALGAQRGWTIERNPWFHYEQRLGPSGSVWYSPGGSACSPDIIINTGGVPSALIVVEVKLVYVPDAIIKLRELYCPVVARALENPAITPLVIVKNILSTAPAAYDHMSEAIGAGAKGVPLLQWLGHGPILW